MGLFKQLGLIVFFLNQIMDPPKPVDLKTHIEYPSNKTDLKVMDTQLKKLAYVKVKQLS